MKIYVASSWRNEYQPSVVGDLRDCGHEVYDFRNPKPGDNGFGWREIDPNWKRWTPKQFISGLLSDVAAGDFRLDYEAMEWADACVLILPCGRSAHLEAGWFVGRNKPLFILINPGGHSYSDKPCSVCGDLDGCHGGNEPELMYLMAGNPLSQLHDSMAGLLGALGTPCETRNPEPVSQ